MSGRNEDMSTRYTLKLWLDDMGSFTQPGCRDSFDALWHVNKAREHDGLDPITERDLVSMLDSPRSNTARAVLIPEHR